MISVARLVLDRNAAGTRPTCEELDAVPRAQFDIYFEELAPICTSSLPVVPRPQRNALRIEVLPSREPRCSQRSPDGRGLAWVMSGGDPLAYGLCARSACPRLRTDSATNGGGQ